MKVCLAALALLIASAAGGRAAAPVPSAGPAPDDEELTERHRRSIDKATRWILQAQNRDGSWGLEKLSAGDVTCTALAGLALMAAGNTEKNGPDGSSVEALRAASSYVLERARKARNDIVTGSVTLIQNKLGTKVHNFFAVIFLTQIYGMRPAWLEKEHLEEMRETIGNLVAIIAQSQESDGSWHKQTFGSLKATCMAWLALRAASSAGIEIRKAVVDKTVEFIKKQYNPATKLFDRGNQMGGYQSIYATASSVRVLYGMGYFKAPEATGAAEAFLSYVKSGQMGGQYLTVEGEDYLSAAMMTQALIHEGGPRWTRWFGYIRDELVRRQNGDGSWTTTACITGRTFPTASALLTLQAPYRLLPLQDH
jgi:hypothetical protein